MQFRINSRMPPSFAAPRRGWVRAVAFGVTVALAALVGCGPSQDGDRDGRLQVAVSIAPQAWLVQQIGGEHVDLLTIVQPGASPATYQPSDAEVSRIMTSDIYFRVGVPFEQGAWFQAIQTSGKLKIVDMRGDIKLRNIEAHAHHDDEAEAPPDGEHCDEHGCDHGHACSHTDGNDPHIWLSPKLLTRQAEVVAATLTKAAPHNADVYDRNLTILRQRLQDVDAKIRKQLQPFSGRAFFVFHPAWGYFADEYGLRQIAIEIAGKEPSDSELTQLQQQARQAGAQVIFVQPQIAGESAEAIAEAIGGRVEQLDPLAEDVAQGLLDAADAIGNSLSP